MKKLLIILLGMACVAASAQEIIELPLTLHDGYGHFPFGMSGLSTNKAIEKYTDDEWIETRLKASDMKLPEGLTDVEWGDIETNFPQFAYQNYLAGKITRETYESVKNNRWPVDTTMLSQTPVETRIVFAIGKNTAGEMTMVVDTNANRDLTDDARFILPENPEMHRTEVSAQVFRDDKIVSVTVPLSFCHEPERNLIWHNFPLYATTEFRGEKLALADPISFSFSDFMLVKVREDMAPEANYRINELYEKNNFLEFGGELWRIVEVNTNRMALVLENTELSKNELETNQTGFKAPAFEGREFTTGETISLESLRGKFVLLDFWGTWCGPCIAAIPEMKKLYENTSREQLEIIGIVERSKPEWVAEAIEKHGITWPQLVSGPENDIVKKYNVTGFPTLILIAPDGTVVLDVPSPEIVQLLIERLNESSAAAEKAEN